MIDRQHNQTHRSPAVRLFLGGYSSYICGERFDLAGDLEFSAAHHPRTVLRLADTNAFLDSGAFTDPPHKRLFPEDALDRQLRWEKRTAELSGLDERWMVS